MNQSPEINELATALAAAQGELTNPEKTKEAKAGSFSYKYADLADVVNVIRGPLSKNGIAYTQMTQVDGTGMFIETRLMHKSGQWISGIYPVCSIGGDHQKMGAAMSYSRRYALLAMLGIVADEDTDGQGAASGPESGRKPAQNQQRTQEPTQAEKDGAEDVKTAVMACKTVTALEELAGSGIFKGMVANLPQSLGQMVRREWSDRKAWLKSKEQTEAKNDEITGNANAA
jgi:hypothetical protein